MQYTSETTFAEHNSNAYHEAFWYGMGKHGDNVSDAASFATFYVTQTWEDFKSTGAADLGIVQRYAKWRATFPDEN
jgi:hypothetical protein